MPTEVCLQVEGVDLGDEHVERVIGEHLADYLWGSVDGLVTVTVYVDDSDVAAGAIEAARSVEHRLPAAKVRRVHRDLVTASDIAARVGVSREAVRKWSQRSGNDGFPSAFGVVGVDGRRPSKLWLWADVLPWLERVSAIDMDEHLPNDSDVAHIDACLAKVESYLDREWQTVSTAQTAPDAFESTFSAYVNAAYTLAESSSRVATTYAKMSRGSFRMIDRALVSRLGT